MARLPRLALADLPHLVALYGHNRQPAFADDDDRRAFLEAWREAAALHPVALHAYVLLDDHVHLLATPLGGPALSPCIQAVGRRYVARFNRRHGRSGALWAGRFRATVVQPGLPVLQAQLFIDSHPVRAGWAGDAASAAPRCSAAAHRGLARDPLLTALPAYWALGNTPFEREAHYQRLLDEGLPARQVQALAEACRKGWPVGDAGFIAQVQQRTDRPVQPRPRGRPARNLQSSPTVPPK